MKTKELVQPIKLIMEGASKLIIEIYESQKNIDVQTKDDDSPSVSYTHLTLPTNACV